MLIINNTLIVCMEVYIVGVKIEINTAHEYAN